MGSKLFFQVMWKLYYKLFFLSFLQYGFQSIMGVEDCLKSIILCLRIDSLKTRALVVKVWLECPSIIYSLLHQSLAINPCPSRCTGNSFIRRILGENIQKTFIRRAFRGHLTKESTPGVNNVLLKSKWSFSLISYCKVYSYKWTSYSWETKLLGDSFGSHMPKY